MVTCPTPVPAPQRGQLRQVRGSLGLTHLASDPRGRLSPAAALGPLTRGDRRGAPRICCTGNLPLPDAQRPEMLPTPLGCVPDIFPEKDIILVVSRQFSYEIVL